MFVILMNRRAERLFRDLVVPVPRDGAAIRREVVTYQFTSDGQLEVTETQRGMQIGIR